MPKLSVIVPIYNTEQYLKKCIDSILGQTYRDFELILVDDGSGDASPEICDAYGEMDSRVKVIHKENGGQTSARKEGVRLSKGEFLAFVDSDDWIEGNMFEAMISAQERTGADIIIEDYYIDNERGLFLQSHCIEKKQYDRKEMEDKVLPRLLFDRERHYFGLDPILVNKIFRKTLFLPLQNAVKEGFPIGEDAAVFIPYMMKANSCVILNTSHYHYIENPESITRRYDCQFYKKLDKLFSYLKSAVDLSAYRMQFQLDSYVCLLTAWGLRLEMDHITDKPSREDLAQIYGHQKQLDWKPHFTEETQKALSKKDRQYLTLASENKYFRLYRIYQFDKGYAAFKRKVKDILKAMIHRS